LLSRGTAQVTIDACALAEDDRRRLEQLVSDARFFELPARLPAHRGGDDRSCQITIEDRGRMHSVSVSDPVPGPALQRLINCLHTLAKTSES
jgi:Emfourin